VSYRHDRMFESVVLSDSFKSKEIFVINLNYKEKHHQESLLRKVLWCEAKLTFDRQVSKLLK